MSAGLNKWLVVGGDPENGGLESIQTNIEEVTREMQAATSAFRGKSATKVTDKTRNMDKAAAMCQDLVD